MTTDTTDTLEVQSGTMQTTNSTDYTVNITGTAANTATVTVNSGATLGYAGSNALGKAINANFNTANNVQPTIVNNGTISSSIYSIFVTNSTLNSGTLTVTNNSTIIGSIYVNNIQTVNLNFGGAATLAGGINLSGGTTRALTIGNPSTCNFTTQGTFDGITALTLTNSSTLTQNHAFSQIGTIAIGAGSTYNVNATLGSGTGDITNSGTMNIAANITKTGGFTTNGAGNTNVTQAVTVSTSTYANTATHTATITDVNTIGAMTYTGAGAPSMTNFALAYGNGYLTGGTYTLFTSTQVDIAGTPNFSVNSYNSMFVTFSTPVKSTNRTITTTVTRNPFTSFTSSPFAQNIAGALENIGNNNPTNDQLQLLNAVEACTSAACVQSAMLQLGPLVSAPLYAYTIENVTLRQAQLRLASLRGDHYYAGALDDYDQFIMGDLLRENYVWIRPYGIYANQRAKDDILGYYATTGGFAIGLDRNLDTRYNLGLAFAYSYSNVRDKVNSTMSGTKVKSYQGMLYGTYNFDSSRFLDWIASITGNQYNGSRYIQINNFVATAESKYSSQIFTIKGIWGKDYAMFDYFQVTPEASLLYSFAKQYTYQESGALGANLVVNRQNANTVQLGIGGKLAVPLAIMPSVVVPEVRAMYLYNVINGKQNSTFNFIGGGNQVLSQMTPARSTLLYGGSLTVAVYDSLQIKGAIEATVADRYSSYWVYLNIKYLL